MALDDAFLALIQIEQVRSQSEHSWIMRHTHYRFHWNLPFFLRGVAVYCNRATKNPLSVPLEPTILLKRCCN